MEKAIIEKEKKQMTNTKRIMDELRNSVPGDYVNDCVADVLYQIFDESNISEEYKAEAIYAMVRTYIVGYLACKNPKLLSTK